MANGYTFTGSRKWRVSVARANRYTFTGSWWRRLSVAMANEYTFTGLGGSVLVLQGQTDTHSPALGGGV